MLRHCCALTDTQFISNQEKLLVADEWNRFEHAIDQRRRGVPIAHITGIREFWSMELLVTPEVLIPRPETELLVEIALEKLDKKSSSFVVDLGTGGGAIALAIASERPRCHVIATDNSKPALAVAQQNARRLKIHNVEFRESDWFNGVDEKQFDLVVSNPPYVCADDPHLTRGDLCFEPHSALAAGDDGLDAIRQIVSQASSYLKDGGFLLIEHGCDQAQDVRGIFDTNGFRPISTYNDLASFPRVCLGKKHQATTATNHTNSFPKQFHVT